MLVSNLQIKLFSKKYFLLLGLIFLLTLNSSAQSKQVIAKKGDGIYRLLSRNGLSASEYMNDFIQLNKSKLGKNNSLYAGVKYILPDKKGGVSDSKAVASSNSGSSKYTVHYDIFGKDYADVEVKSNELKGAVYYLVGGHGGPDPGAMGKYNGFTVCEDEYAYDVTLRLARNLISKGATVYLITRDPNDGIRDEMKLNIDHDEVCYPHKTIPLNQVKRLRQRCDAVNRLYKKNKGKFQRMIALHIDSRKKNENIDIFFYYDKRSKTGKKAAGILRNTIETKYHEHQPNRGYTGSVSPRNLYVVRNTWPTAIFIELGNMNNSRDVKRLVFSNNRQAVANWLTDGLEKDFKTNK
jgi:N-acetylmuramoyl-L-alanine amidase